jgi:hypothetical protein
MENVSDARREARIEELRKLVMQGEYQIDPQLTAARLVDEHVAERSTTEENTRSVAATAPSSTTPPK